MVEEDEEEEEEKVFENPQFSSPNQSPSKLVPIPLPKTIREDPTDLIKSVDPDLYD